MGIYIIFVLSFNENIWCGHSWEAPHWGASHEYKQHMFLSEDKKSINTFGWKKYLIWNYGIVIDYISALYFLKKKKKEKSNNKKNEKQTNKQKPKKQTKQTYRKSKYRLLQLWLIVFNTFIPVFLKWTFPSLIFYNSSIAANRGFNQKSIAKWQTVQILMRWFITYHLIWTCTVCKTICIGL